MNAPARTGLICFTAISLFAGGSPGIRPRASAGDYPSHYAASDFAIGATVIPPAEVRKMFMVDLNAAGYLVVEVGIFPLNRNEVDLSPADFSLLADADRASVRPVDSDAIAATINRKYAPPAPRRNSDVYTTGTVEIARVPTFDPNSGKPSGHVTAVGTGAGVGVGAPPPLDCRFNDCNGASYPSASAPRTGDIEQELWQKSLPDGKMTTGVAGYLYFPKPSGKAKNGPWQLVMDGQSGRVKLTIR